MRLRIVAPLAVAVALAVPAQADEIEGHATNAFLPGFPEEIDSLTRAAIESEPDEGRITAVYGNADDSRNLQVLLYRLSDDGIAGNVERAEAFMAGGEIPVAQASVESPGGAAMECMATRVGELAYNLCIAEVRGRALNVQVGDVIDPQAKELPEAVVTAARDLAGRIVDSIAAAPES
ncbi:hypothetical protein GI374_07355 [Paracoccus sp. S-4012]|uniref:hypothetical protein n=1 Tax=Paracoccus sp. S-4012 TaxID=2665648 RepID=UPI0012B004A8|nr:hypothetical protein [Paracoccus sp. S-4012]MRX50265.1 hypothetical protein [Paracoccus sp. S-4012]